MKQAYYVSNGKQHIPPEDFWYSHYRWKQDKFGKDVKYSNSHARLGEQEQEEWLNNEKLSIESKRRESPFLTRRDKFKKEFMRRIIPWEMINISWDTFPYHIQ